MRTAMSLVIVVGMAACVDGNREPVELPAGDSFVFATEVQPYIGLGCGSLDCHGDQGRALRIYAKFGLRELAENRAQATTGLEVAANVQAFAALDSGDPRTHLALLKGLATNAGGAAHVGGDIWDSESAAGYQCLRAYFAGTTNPTACADALAEVDID